MKINYNNVFLKSTESTQNFFLNLLSSNALFLGGATGVSEFWSSALFLVLIRTI